MELRYTVWEKVTAWRQGVIYGTGDTVEKCDENAIRQYLDNDYCTELDYETMEWTGNNEVIRDGGTYDGKRIEPKNLIEG